jgi:hypothetical protein
VRDGARPPATGNAEPERRCPDAERQRLVLDACDDRRQQHGCAGLCAAARGASRGLCHER